MSDKYTESNPFYYGRPGKEQIAGAPVKETVLSFDPNIVVRKTVTPAPLPVLPVPQFPTPSELETIEPFTVSDAEGEDALDFIDEQKPIKKGKIK